MELARSLDSTVPVSPDVRSGGEAHCTSPSTPQAGTNQNFFHRLPTELICEIFHLSLPDLSPARAGYTIGWWAHPTELLHNSKYYPSVVSLMLVSKHWYFIINGTPSFWPFVSTSSPLDFQDRVLSRSANRRLDVAYNYLDTDIVRPHQFPDILGGHIDRWRNARLVMRQICRDDRLVEYIGRPAPNITAFSLKSETLPGRHSFRLFRDSAARLEFLLLKNVHIDWRFTTFPSLQVLNLEGITTGLSLLHLSSLIRDCPIRTLRLVEVRVVDEFGSSFPPLLPAPQLQEMMLGNMGTAMTERLLSAFQKQPPCAHCFIDLVTEQELRVDSLTDQLAYWQRWLVGALLRLSSKKNFQALQIYFDYVCDRSEDVLLDIQDEIDGEPSSINFSLSHGEQLPAEELLSWLSATLKMVGQHLPLQMRISVPLDWRSAGVRGAFEGLNVVDLELTERPEDGWRIDDIVGLEVSMYESYQRFLEYLRVTTPGTPLPLPGLKNLTLNFDELFLDEIHSTLRGRFNASRGTVWLHTLTMIGAATDDDYSIIRNISRVVERYGTELTSTSTFFRYNSLWPDIDLSPNKIEALYEGQSPRPDESNADENAGDDEEGEEEEKVQNPAQ